MSMEADLNALLVTKCPRVFADVAQEGTPAPYVTWQGIGGEWLGFLNNTPGDKRSTLMQISVWALTRMESTTLCREIESAVCASTAFIATPQGEPLSTYEPDTKLHGAIQRFVIRSSR